LLAWIQTPLCCWSNFYIVLSVIIFSLHLTRQLCQPSKCQSMWWVTRAWASLVLSVMLFSMTNRNGSDIAWVSLTTADIISHFDKLRCRWIENHFNKFRSSLTLLNPPYVRNTSTEVLEILLSDSSTNRSNIIILLCFFWFVVNIFKFFDLRTIIKSVLEFQFLIHYHFKCQQSFLKSMCSLKLVSKKSYRVWISLPGSLVCIYNSISFLKFLVTHFCDD